MTIARRSLVAAAVLSASGAMWSADRTESTPLPPAATRVAPQAPAPRPAPTAATDTQGASRDVEAGAKLFVAYNCGDCHGAGGSGAMGPSLQDNRWRFGGSEAEIYRSIADGRPEGMPAWGPLIPAAHIRQLVAYAQSLGAGKDVTTENFTGATVERSGH